MRVKFAYKIEGGGDYYLVNKKIREPKNWNTFSDEEKIDYLLKRYYYETQVLAAIRCCPKDIGNLDYIIIDKEEYWIFHEK